MAYRHNSLEKQEYVSLLKICSSFSAFICWRLCWGLTSEVLIEPCPAFVLVLWFPFGFVSYLQQI